MKSNSFCLYARSSHRRYSAALALYWGRTLCLKLRSVDFALFMEPVNDVVNAGNSICLKDVSDLGRIEVSGICNFLHRFLGDLLKLALVHRGIFQAQ
jgi:diketogulonate reductase-like aldo/keto reductase